jgi:hypothetical protein
MTAGYPGRQNVKNVIKSLKGEPQLTDLSISFEVSASV